MGLCGSSDVRVRSPSEVAENNIFKMVLLGPADAGKSTLIKQAQRCYSTRGFTDEDRHKWTRKVHGNIITFLKLLVSSKPFVLESEMSEWVHGLNEDDFVNSANVANFKLVWALPRVQAVFEERDLFHFPSEFAWFLNDIDRIASDDYIPNEADILRCRDFSSEGITDYLFEMDECPMRLIELVGPNRGKFKKWLDCFSRADAIIFVLSLGDYNMQSKTCPGLSYMGEVLQYLTAILDSSIPNTIPIIFLFNKKDEFERKLKTIPVNVCPEFASHAVTLDPAIAFDSINNHIMNFIGHHNLTIPRMVYTHATCLTDTHGVQMLFETIRSVVLRSWMDNLV